MRTQEPLLHILIYLHSLSSGGAERVISDLANHWSAQGWDVTIVTVTDVSRDFFHVHSSVRRVGLGLDVASNSVPAALRHNWRRLSKLRAILQELRPDIALSLMASANCTLLLAALGTSVRVIGCERTYPPAESLGRVWEWLRRRTYPYLDAVVVQTHRSAEWLQKAYSPRRIAVIPNMVAVPLRSVEPCVPISSQYEVANGSKLLLAVGRLGPEKAFDRLIAAFAQLAPDYLGWQLFILGEGRSRRDLEEQVVSLGLGERVRMPGTVGNVGDWYEAADIYVVTSHFEGFPNSLLEAMAYGLPAVSVDCETGPKDILRDKVDGLLVPQHDGAALVDALGQVMADESLRRRYAGKAVEVQARFSVEKVTGQWAALFEDVMRRGT